MNLETITTNRPKLSLQYGRIKSPRLSRERRPQPVSGTLSAQELQRIVSEMVG